MALETQVATLRRGSGGLQGRYDKDFIAGLPEDFKFEALGFPLGGRDWHVSCSYRAP